MSFLMNKRGLILSPTSLLIMSVIFAGIGQLSLKTGVGSLGALSLARPGDIFRALTTPLVVIGFACYAGSSLTWLVALSQTTLSHAFTFAALNFVFVMSLSWIVLKEPMTVMKAMGIVLICLGFLVANR